VPKFQAAKGTGKQAMPYGKSKVHPTSLVAPPSNIQAVVGGSHPTPRSLAAVAAMQQEPDDIGPSNGLTFAPIDSSLTRDSSSKAFMRELRKVIERSDVIIQVLDSRDPEGTRSRWVEEEVRKRDMDGKKLLAVMNKIGKSFTGDKRRSMNWVLTARFGTQSKLGSLDETFTPFFPRHAI
jgi:nuclear GTP-binding protein